MPQIEVITKCFLLLFSTFLIQVLVEVIVFYRLKFFSVLSKQILLDYLGLIEFVNDPNESAIDIFQNICKIMEDYLLKFENLTSYGADNANVNYGEYHSVFTLLKDKAPHLMKGKHKCLL